MAQGKPDSEGDSCANGPSEAEHSYTKEERD
jgi:hypothetical protein